MLSASEPDAFTIDVDYTGPITATDFIASDFLTTPSVSAAVGVTQNGPGALELDFGAQDISGDTDLTYSGSNPHVLSPDTISL
jgi:hypothetical protein